MMPMGEPANCTPMHCMACLRVGLGLTTGAPAALAGAEHVYKVQALGGPLSVTLVWTDFPALASGG